MTRTKKGQDLIRHSWLMTQHYIKTHSGDQRHLGTNGCQRGRQNKLKKRNPKEAQKEKYPRRDVISAIIAGAYAQRIYSPVAFIRRLTHSTSDVLSKVAQKTISARL